MNKSFVTDLELAKKLKKIRRNNNMIRFSAWCSGKAYNYPDRVFVCKESKEIVLFTKGAYLAKFFFNTKKDFINALRISKRALNNAHKKYKNTEQGLLNFNRKE